MNHEDLEAVLLLKEALKKIRKLHKSSSEGTEIKMHPSGCCTITADGKDLYSFFNVYEMTAWMQEFVNDN